MTTADATKFTGSGPGTGFSQERWNVVLRGATPTAALSEQHVTGTVDLNSTSEQTVTLDHNLLLAPAINKISWSLTYAGANTTWAIQYVKVESVSSTQIVMKVKLSTAAGSAVNGTLNVHARLT